MISIIVPVYNGREFLHLFLKNYVAMESFELIQHEIIFVDNGSQDGFKEELFEAIKFYQLSNIDYVVYSEHQSSYASRNYGVSVSKGNLLAFVDIDCVFDSQWLKNCYKYDDSKNMVVAGNVLLFSKSKKYNVYELYDFNTSFQMNDYKRKHVGITANLLVDREAFLTIGGFQHVGSGGDINFCRLCVETNMNYNFDEQLLVRHPARNTYKEIYVKLVRVSTGHAELYYNKSLILKSIFLFRTVLGLFLPLSQLKSCKKAYADIPYMKWIILSFLIIWFGLLSRFIIIVKILIKK